MTSCRWSQNLQYIIQRVGVFSLRLRLPDGLTIESVDSDSLQAYRVDEGVLTITLAEKTAGDVSVKIRGNQSWSSNAEAADLPVLEPLDVERETAVVRLYVPPSLEAVSSASDVSSATPAAVAAGETWQETPLAGVWQFSRRPVRIPVRTLSKPTRLSASVGTDVNVGPQRTRVTTQIDYLVENAGVDTFRFEVPEAAMDTLVIESIGDSRTSPAIRTRTAGTAVEGWVPWTVVMQRPVTGLQRFRVTYDVRPTLVAPPVESASVVSENGETASLPTETTTDDGVKPTPSPTTGETASPTADDTASPPNGETASPAAEEATSPPTGETTSPLSSSGTATKDPEEDAGPSGASGPSTALAPESVSLYRTVIEILRPLGLVATANTQATALEQITGEIRVDKDASLTITSYAQGADVEAIDVRELVHLPTSGAGAYRYFRHPPDEQIVLEIVQARYEVQEVIPTVVSRGLVEMMLDEEPTVTYRCRYMVRSTERQRLRIELPSGMQLLSMTIDGNEVRPEPDPSGGSGGLWDAYFLRVRRSGESDEPFALALQFLRNVKRSPFKEEGYLRGRVDMPLPRIVSGDTLAPVQQLRVVAWVPDEYALVGDPGGFELQGRTSLLSSLLGGPTRVFTNEDLDAWIGCDSSGVLDFPTAGRHAYRYSNLGGANVIKLLWWDRIKVTVLVSLALALIAWMLLGTSWENKLGMLLLLAFAGTLFGLWSSMHALGQGLSAARFGLAFLLGLWLLHSLLGNSAARSPLPSASPQPVTSGTPPFAAVVPPPGVFESFHESSEARDDH